MQNPLVTIYSSLSFLFTVQNLDPNFEAQGNSSLNNPHGFWSPPDQRNAYDPGPLTRFRWRSGRVSLIPMSDPAWGMNPQRHDVATIFTQNPDTPHFLAVMINATEINVRERTVSWKTLSFSHRPVGQNSPGIYSSINIFGEQQHIAAPGNRNWLPQLLPEVYNYQAPPGPQAHPAAISAGLIGSIPILLALAAFSAPVSSLNSTLTQNIQPRAWFPHTQGTGRRLHDFLCLISANHQKFKDTEVWW